MSDIDILREAFTEMMAEGYEECFRGKFETAKQALEALDRIEARLIPELPDGWFITNLYSNSEGYVCVLLPKQCVLNTGKRGVGKTAVEAIRAAIKEIDQCQN